MEDDVESMWQVCRGKKLTCGGTFILGSRVQDFSFEDFLAKDRSHICSLSTDGTC